MWSWLGASEKAVVQWSTALRETPTRFTKKLLTRNIDSGFEVGPAKTWAETDDLTAAEDSKMVQTFVIAFDKNSEIFGILAR
jgi:hypothetical protein